MNGASTTSNSNNKTVYLIRHGQSTFNAAYAINKVDPWHFDARLSELGQTQANDLAKHAEGLNVDLIISSPLTRALDTTRRGFSEVIKQKSIKVQVITYHSEHVATSDDNGRFRSHVEKEFPEFDLSHIQERWWYMPEDVRTDEKIDPEEYFKTIGFKEPWEHLDKRIQQFKDYIMDRNESVIAVIGHSEFFHQLFEKKLPWFKNCQILKWNPFTNETEWVTN
ncbi:phosphoglycerate/bisphosphoglycerate mutase family protein [Cavenderia fasciculata]|uniref:Phosphoglycerate/bisphosphoglycerate mutase family protein n=1 Tax=Cavenderia fasciculata TaxID=261658 RepID=F4PQZ7_CACFS|nr:phosphoglycerate/bisphosphoglycerate mutase family protein [Cavenderia fasciculata]EGG21262.1 phosphoglycerate/bisphosphoglycerate mutase family protein [Cavenderia fasciculata]|eukprot:XP_004359112.1 phosphoglycerate/bisphosphoglycerate mutase family protein [Cavenderia fasciculata]